MSREDCIDNENMAGAAMKNLNRKNSDRGIRSMFTPEPTALALLSEFERLYQTGDRKFQHDLHRMVSAFVREAVTPWQQAFTDAAMRSSNPLRSYHDDLNPPLSMELWRGQFAGQWLRITQSVNGSRISLESMCSIPGEPETWTGEWGRGY